MAKLKVSDWLQERVVREARLCFLSPLLLMPAAIIASAATSWVIYMVVLVGFGSIFRLSFAMVGWITAACIGVLFVWQLTKGRVHCEEWQFSGKGIGAADLAIRVVTGSPFASFALDPAAGKMFVRLWATLLLSGPRLCVLTWDLIQRARRLKVLDVTGCGKVISALLKRQSRISVDELLKEIPTETLRTVLPQLADIDGVVFLNSEPLGLTLAPRFQQDFQDWRQQAATS